MRSLCTFVIAAVIAAGLAACGGSGIGDASRILWPRDVVVGPSIVSVDVPSGGFFHGTLFTFSAETVGSPVASWHWDFGGGADPNESSAAQPGVILLNYSMTCYAVYTCTLTVTDANGNSDTVQVEYQIGPGFDLDPQFYWAPRLQPGNPAIVIFSVSDWGIGNEVIVTIEVIEGEGITVEPATMTVPLDSGPYEVTVTNDTLYDVYTLIRITLDNGYFQTSYDVTGTVYGLNPQPGSIAIQPVTATVSLGEVVLVEVYACRILYPAAYFDCIELTECDGLSVIYESWNLGRPGGDTWQKDGTFWDAFPDPVCDDGIDIDMLPWAPAWSISAEGSNPVGAPTGVSGPLFNVQFEAVEPGTWYLDFVSENTHYLEPDGETQHFFTDYLGCEVTVTEAEG